MDKDDVREIYDEDYARGYNQDFLLGELYKPIADFEQETIEKLLNEIGEDARWLDVACGTGYFLSRFPNVERAGLDISPAMLEVAKHGNPNILLVQGDYREKRLEWEEKWDLVSCMWWAYSYVNSFPELEEVIKNLSDWTSDKGVCFLPVCDPEEIGTGEQKLPYTREQSDIYQGAGTYRIEAVIWSWVDRGKHHINLLAPQVENMITLFQKYFEKVEIIEYPNFKGAERKALVARYKKERIEPKNKNIKTKRIKPFFLLSIFKIIRLSEWWLYKIAPLLAIAYAEILLTHFPTNRSVAIVLTFLFSISSVAAYGYIVNDIFDIEVDGKVGKSNGMSQLFPWQRFLFCLLFITTGFTVPILMNFGTLPVILLAINYLLPTLYSAPPFRLKEKGIWGVLSDAAGAHLVPTLFVATTFLNLSPDPQPKAIPFSVIAASLAFFVGLRGILLHQLWDRDNDIHSGISTFVTQFKSKVVRRWINRFIFPGEILLLGGLATVLSESAPSLLGFFTIYFVYTLTKLNITKKKLDPSPPIGENIVLHDLYEVWLPLALSVILATREPLFLVFVALTLVLFYPSVKVRVTEVIDFIKNMFIFWGLTYSKGPKKKQLAKQVENLQRELKTQQQETQQAQTEAVQYRDSLQQLREESDDRLVAIHAQLTETQQQLEAICQTSANLRQQLNQAQLQIEQLETQQQQSKVNIAESEAQRHEIQTKLERNKAEIAEKNVELENLKAQQHQTRFMSIIRERSRREPT